MKYVIAILTLLIPAPAFSAEPLGIAATYSVDKVACRLYVPDTWINDAIYNAQVQYGITREDAILKAAYAGQALINDLVRTRGLNEWCEARRLK